MFLIFFLYLNFGEIVEQMDSEVEIPACSTNKYDQYPKRHQTNERICSVDKEIGVTYMHQSNRSICFFFANFSPFSNDFRSIWTFGLAER